MIFPNHKIFVAEQLDETLILMPQGDPSSFRYNDIHTETNALLDYIQRGRTKHLVIDFGQVELVSSIIINSMVKMARKVGDRGGDCVFCSANQAMCDVLRSMNFTKLWPYHDSRQASLDYLNRVV
jgi:anti-anti-sigma factor